MFTLIARILKLPFTRKKKLTQVFPGKQSSIISQCDDGTHSSPWTIPSPFSPSPFIFYSMKQKQINGFLAEG